MERLYCLLVTDFLLLSQLFVIPRAFIIILDAVDKLLCINTIISQENFIVTRALNIMLSYMLYIKSILYEGGSIYNGNTLITPPTKALEFYAICGTKDQGLTF